MKTASFLILALCLTAFARQTTQFAHGTYARNGILIGLSDLAPLRDCQVQSMEGKARSIEIDKTAVTFDLKDGDQRMTFRFPLSKLDTPERRSLRRNFLQKSVPLRATAYACPGAPADQPLETITLARVY